MEPSLHHGAGCLRILTEEVGGHTCPIVVRFGPGLGHELMRHESCPKFFRVRSSLLERKYLYHCISIKNHCITPKGHTLYAYVCEYKSIDACYIRSIGFNILQNMHIEVLNFSSMRCADLVFKSFNPFIM